MTGMHQKVRSAGSDPGTIVSWCSHASQVLGNVRNFRGADEEVHLRNRPGQFRSMTLGQAAGDDQTVAGRGLFICRGRKDGLNGLFLGG